MTATVRVEAGGRRGKIEIRSFSPTLADHLAAAGFPLNTRCSQRGLCKGCRIIDESGAGRLACEMHLAPGDDLAITIPARSLLSHAPAVVSDFRTGVPTGSDPAFSTQKPFGLAVDIGTTTVAVLLAELSSGRVLARASSLNAQVASGDNVLTRIHLCQQNKENIARLREAFWQSTFAPLLRRVLAAAGVSADDLAGAVVAGNTTMLHLACGEDPTPMGMVPFRPAFLDERRFSGAASLFPGLPEVIFLPGLSAYVGADIVAGAACRGLEYSAAPQLLVDVGTNGEMVLADQNGLLACATAAGPAFEGCGLLCGMRAADGVIGRIEISADPFGVTCNVIGGPSSWIHGITGSAYVDFLASAHGTGLLEDNGRFAKSFVAAHPGWFREEENGLSFLPEPGHPDIRIGEVDVALLLQAKAAIAAGVETLLEQRGIRARDVGRLHLAGGFGLHLSIPNAIACGLLPGFSAEQIEAVGNTSLGGAYLAMLDKSLLEEMAALRSRSETIELNLDPGFEDRYLDHLSLAPP